MASETRRPDPPNLAGNYRSVLEARCKDFAGSYSPDSTHFSYKLANERFAIDVPFSNQLDFDEKRMSIVIPFADGNRRDGVGDLVEVVGIHLERHRSNPICQFNHGKGNSDFADWPVALAEDPDSKAYTVEIDPISKTGRANCFFYKGSGIPGADRSKEKAFALFCEQLYDLLVKRWIRSGSFTYQIVKAYPLQPDYQAGTPQGLHLLETNLLELGPVVLPANQDTVSRKGLGDDPIREILCKGQVCGKALSPYLRKSLEPFASERKATMMTGEKKKNIPGDLNWLKEEETEQEHEKALTRCPECGGHITPDAQGGQCDKCGWRPTDSKAAKVKVLRQKYKKGLNYPTRMQVQNQLDKLRSAMSEQQAIRETEQMMQVRDIRVNSSGTVVNFERIESKELSPLTETDVPPAKWKPGAGAVKSSRGPYDLDAPRTDSQESEFQRAKEEGKLAAQEAKQRGEKRRPRMGRPDCVYADGYSQGWNREVASDKSLKPGVGIIKAINPKEIKVVKKPDGWYIVDLNSGNKDGPFQDENTAKEEADAYIRIGGIGRKYQPSDKISPKKAERMLEDRTAHGKPLTGKQERMLYAAANKLFNDERTGRKFAMIDNKRMEVDFFNSSLEARHFQTQIESEGKLVYRVAKDENGKYLVYWDTVVAMVKALKDKYRKAQRLLFPQAQVPGHWYASTRYGERLRISPDFTSKEDAQKWIDDHYSELEEELTWTGQIRMNMVKALKDKHRKGYTKKARKVGPDGKFYVDCECGEKVPIVGDSNKCPKC